MTAPVQNFSFFVGGIEDAVVAALQAKVGKDAENGYAGDIAPYSGELDDTKKLREALSALHARFPLFLVSYTDGVSTRQTQIAPGVGAPWEVRHDCTVLALVIADDARGETDRRKGAYDMASDVLAALENRQFAYVYLDDDDNEQKIMLTPGEFISTGIEHVASFGDVTAYAVPFETWFKYLSPDRRDPATPLEEVVFAFHPLDSSGEHIEPGPGVGSIESPGVHVKLLEE